MTKSIVWRIAFVPLAVVLTMGAAVHAEEDDAGKIETDHLFAFNVGTDMDEPGSKEIDAAVNGRFSRRAGTYSAVESELSFQYQATRNLQVELEASGTFHHIKDVPDMDDRSSAAFGGLSIGLSYRLLDRAKYGFGLAVSAAPYWTRVDDDSGEPVNGFGSEFVVASDIELIPQLLVGVVNVSYEPEASKSRIDGTWSRQNTIGFSGGLMVKLRDNVFAGLEARYMRRYDSVDFSAFAGQAFYLGPTVSINLSEHTWVTVGWSAQVAGRANGEDGALDLTNFEHHQARLAFGVSF
jgi:opacity protein-like surface antigen